MTPLEQAHLTELICLARGRKATDADIAADLRAAADRLSPPAADAEIAADLRAAADRLSPSSAASTASP